MLKGLISTILAVGSMGAPILASEQEQNNSIVERVINEPISAVVYDDSNYTITLTADEMNDCVFNNLLTYLIQQGTSPFVQSPISYNNLSFVLYEIDDYASFKQENGSARLSINDEGVWTYQNVVGQFESGIVWNLDEYSYSGVKSVIELDIPANQPSQNSMPSVSDLFGYITQGVTAFIGSLGEAFNSVVALFWTTGTNAGPTFLGLLMLVSIGAGLIFLAYNVIKKLVYRLRG